MNKKLIIHNLKLKTLLEGLYNKYNHKKFIPPDPLQFVYHYTKKSDMEIAGFLSAMFAYGAVEQIEKFLTGLLGKMGGSPCDFVRNFSAKDKILFKPLKYRFNTGDDIINLLGSLKKVLNRYGSLEKLFLEGYSPADANIIPASVKFMQTLNPASSPGLKFLLSNPVNGGTCKRLMLFLRWMVREDEVDAGLWSKVDKSKLIVPVDVHMGRLSRIIGLHSKKTYNLKTAAEVTKGFAEITPEDPVKYDFALCRIGILENCSGKPNKYCPECELAQFCCRKPLII
ncbi:MAG: TIGR02757 family protein [Planctomycetes bacterium GWF2_41_51]|nr:MAG: TIGR02757 family protein [Planctomycetes bacterium GWF2_41_51]HBG28309.1 TIGR02757 family protein [Phycisphaerales bacterium]